MGDQVAFAVLGFATLSAAVMVVRAEDLVRGVLWLAVTLLGTAGLYATLDAGFLAAIQVLLYTGGVITLMLFAVLLTRRREGPIPAGGVHRPVAGALAAATFFALVAFAVLRTDGLPARAGRVDPRALGLLLTSDLALPFEALSLLLLAGMVGAIVLARRQDP